MDIFNCTFHKACTWMIYLVVDPHVFQWHAHADFKLNNKYHIHLWKSNSSCLLMHCFPHVISVVDCWFGVRDENNVSCVQKNATAGTVMTIKVMRMMMTVMPTTIVSFILKIRVIFFWIQYWHWLLLIIFLYFFFCANFNAGVCKFDSVLSVVCELIM